MGGHARACPLRDGAPTPPAHDPAGDEPGGAAAAREPAPGATAGSDSEDDQSSNTDEYLTQLLKDSFRMAVEDVAGAEVPM